MAALNRKYTFISCITALLITGCLLPGIVTAQIVGGNCFIKGQYVELGIGPCGTFGSSIDAPAGYHVRGGTNPNRLGFVADRGKDGWDLGSPNFCGDYYVPGTPEEGWGITVNGVNYNNNLLCGTTDIPGAVIEYRNNGVEITGTWRGEKSGLLITAKTTVPLDKLYFITEVTIKNTSDVTQSNVYYMRNIDPDNEVTLSGNYQTKNEVVFQNPNLDNKAVVSATGLSFGCYLALGTRDCRAKVTKGGFSNRSAANIWNCIFPLTCSGVSTADEAISLSFQLGDIAPGAQKSLKFVNVLNLSDLDEAIDRTGPSFLIGEVVELNSGDTTQSCSTGPTTFEVVNTGGFDNWTWSPATALNTTIGPLVVFDGSIDTITYTATGTNSCGTLINIKFTSIRGNVTPVPKAGPISGPLSLCAPGAIANYSIAPIPRAIKYKWTVPPGVSILSGDGTTNIVVDLSGALGNDTISVRGVNVCGPGDTSMIAVSVCNCGIVYPILPANTTICPGDSVLLSTTNISGAVYKWYRNGVLIPGVNGNTYRAKDSGTYNIIIATSPLCSNNTTSGLIKFSDPPTVNITPAGNLFKCLTGGVLLTANVTNPAPGGVQYRWYKNGSLISSVGPTFNVTSDGEYYVEVTNTNNCKARSNIDTIVNRAAPELRAYIFTGDSVTCIGKSNTLSASVFSADDPIDTYQWYKDGIAIPGATTNAITTTESGAYSLLLTTTRGCTNLPLRDTVLTYHPTPVAHFKVLDGCANGPIAFNDSSEVAAGGTISEWMWYKNGLLFGSTKDFTQELTPGNYNITLKVKTDKGCESAPVSATLLRFGRPSSDFTIKGTCSDSITSFMPVNVSPGFGNTMIADWLWSFGNGTSSSVQRPSLIYGDAGTYKVTLIYRSDNCPVVNDSISKTIYLGDPLPTRRYANVPVAAGETFALNGAPGGLRYSWDPPFGLSAPEARYTTGVLGGSQQYELHIINSYGCENVDTVMVHVVQDCKIYVPTSFTPNGDGRNDGLRAYIGCLKSLTRFSIYNRNGQLLFVSTDATKEWDGRYKGEPQPTAGYVWMAEGEYKNGQRFVAKGSFVLVR